MAEHVDHYIETPRTDSGALLAVVLVVALIAIVGFALYTYNYGVANRATTNPNSVNVNGTIDLPDTTPTPTNTQPSTTTPGY